MKSMDLNHNHSNSSNNLLALLLFVAAWFTEYLHKISVSDALGTLFQCLSILSVTLLIVINFPKAMKVLFPKKYKKEEEKKDGK